MIGEKRPNETPLSGDDSILGEARDGALHETDAVTEEVSETVSTILREQDGDG